MPGTMGQLRKDLDTLVIRSFIEKAISNYDPDQIYIIYDSNKIEVYNSEVFGIKKARKEFKTYHISYPIRIV